MPACLSRSASDVGVVAVGTVMLPPICSVTLRNRSAGAMEVVTKFFVRVGVRTEKVLAFFLEAVVLGSRAMSSSLVFTSSISMRVGTWMALVERKIEVMSN